MMVEFSNRKLKRCIENDSERRKHFGLEMAKKIKLRMDTLAAAKTLADFYPPNSGPERCHELKGNLIGIFSIDVKQPYRLLFKTVENKQQSESQDTFQLWSGIDKVIIVGIEDTHG
jgi:proteic killer suppression protein